MATGRWLEPNRPEVYRPTADASRGDDGWPTAQLIERMRPEEGWLGLFLVLLLTGTMAWSIADSRWILGQDSYTSFLIWAALAATMWGYLSSRLNISPWHAQALGCVVGAFILIELIGTSLPHAQPGLVGWFWATADSVTEAYLDLTWRHQLSTLQVGHFCLILGILVWGTAQAASYDVFGYHRSVNGVLLLAVVLIANMCLTTNDQFGALVVFSASALVLLLLSHAADERTSWLRHRIWRGRDFQAPHLQGGMAFASVAVVGSLILTSVASSAPLQSVTNNLGPEIQSAFGWMSGLLPNGGASRFQPTADFGNTASIASTFREAARDIFTIRVPSSSISYHWRLVAYDTFQTNGWSVGPTLQDDIIAGESIDAGTLDAVALTTPGRIQVPLVVHVQDSTLQHLIDANEPDSVNVAVQRTTVGTDPANRTVAWLTSGATDYTVSAIVPDTNPNGTGLTEWRLQHAGTDYPPGLLDRFSQGADLVGSHAKLLLNEVQTWAHANGNTFSNEYDIAKAIQSYLQGDTFQYNTDITALVSQCTGLSTVDCFAVIRQGFCEQYATTMTMLMRMEGFPARYVLGYLPGAVDQRTLTEQVTSQQKHAWVEVYFPGYGWIPFDPTGGGIGEPTVLAPGSAVAATPSPFPSLSPDGSFNLNRPTQRPTSGAGATSTTGGFNATLVIVPAILVIVLILSLLVLWRRRPRRLEGPDTVYRNIVKLASRLGYKPKPTQTVFEYTDMLAGVVPRARDPLGVVAAATVEVNYGKRQLGSDRLVSLSAAQTVIRQALLRLAIRMPKLRGRGRGKNKPRIVGRLPEPPRRDG